jgi:hypothetical protein
MTDLFSFGVERTKADVGDTTDNDSEYEGDEEEDYEEESDSLQEEVEVQEEVQVGVDSSYWDVAGPWAEKCKTEKESVCYRTFDYVNRSTLAKVDESVSSSSTFERHWRGVSDSYGGSWGGGGHYATKEEFDELRADLIKWKQNWLSMPYCREKADDFMVRGVRAENIRIFFSNKAKEFIKRTAGWDVDELIKELDAMPETIMTPEIQDKIDNFRKIESDGKAAQDKLWKLERELKEAIEGKTLLNGHMMALKYDEMQDLRQIVKRLEQEQETARKERGHYFL